MADRDIYAEAGHVSCAEAREAIDRYHNAHFQRGVLDVAPRVSIPVNPKRDDDIRLEAFIRRAERMEAELAQLALLRAHPGAERLRFELQCTSEAAEQRPEMREDPEVQARLLLAQLLGGA